MAALFLFIGLILSQYAYSQKDLLEKPYTGKCYLYEQYAVHGYCKDVLGNVTVAQTPKDIEKKDKNFLAIMQNIKLFVSTKRKTSSKQLMSYLKVFLLNTQLISCERREEAMTLIDSITLPPVQELYDCLLKIKWKICHLTHPLCSANTTSGSSTIIFPCQEHCEDTLSLESCQSTIKSVRMFFGINEYCPNYYRSGRYLNCSNYPNRHQKVETNCLWNSEYLKEERQLKKDKESDKNKTVKPPSYDALSLVAMYTGIPVMAVLLISSIAILCFCVKKYTKEKENQNDKDETAEYQTDVILHNHPQFKGYISPDQLKK